MKRLLSVRPRAPFLQVEWILGSPSFFEAFGSSPYIHLVHFLAFEDLWYYGRSIWTFAVVAEQTFTCVALHLQKEEVLSFLMQPWEWICMSFHAHLDRLQFLRPSPPSLLQAVPWILGSPSFFEAFGSSPYIHLVHFLAFEDLWYYGRSIWTFAVVAEQTFTCVALHLQKEEVLSFLMQPWEWICIYIYIYMTHDLR